MKKSLLTAVVFSLLGAFSAAHAAPTEPAAAPATAVAAQAETINLNTADADALSAGLVGIGDAKARAIIEYRQANGPFTSVDDLLEVKGIGTAILEKNRARLSL